jgi:hypothetical protein
VSDKSRNIAVQAAQALVRQLVLVVNNAPLLTEPKPEDTHRGNTPWIIAIPGLGIAVQAVSKSGEPRVGFFDDGEAVAQAEYIWRQCADDPALLDELRKENVWPSDLVEGHKIMHRMMTVPSIELRI